MGCGDVRLLRTIGGLDVTGQERAALNKLTMPGGDTEHGRERRLRLAQRDPALTQRAGLHDVHTMPSAPAAVKRGGGARRTSVSQSSEPTGHFIRCTFAEGVAQVGTIGEFSRKVARPAGLEPATPGLALLCQIDRRLVGAG